MKIKTLWGERKDFEGQSPELMVAWDEESIDRNPDGFAAECDQAIASWRDDLVQWRIIELVVPEHRVTKAFQAPIVAIENPKVMFNDDR